MAHPRRRPRGGPQTGGLGSDPDMGAGQRLPSAGIARHPPRKNGASLLVLGAYNLILFVLAYLPIAYRLVATREMARWALWVAATDCRGAAACFWSFIAKQGRTLLDESDLEMVVILHYK